MVLHSGKRERLPGKNSPHGGGELAIPRRSLYATDSASMMSKALKLIAAVEKLMEEKKKGIVKLRRNPFGKAWGVQVDGDLREQAWLAVMKRGTWKQSLRKVKRSRY